MKRIFILVLFVSFLSCKEDKSSQTKPQENVMAKQSEMAALMLEMYNVNKANKKLVLEGKLPEKLPENFMNIHDAVLTTPSDRDAAFQAYSDFFMENVKTFYNTTNVDSLIMNHNNVVSSCVGCHEVKCPGPISRIQKLYVKQ